MVSSRGYAITLNPQTGERTGQFPLTSAVGDSVVADGLGAWVSEGPLGVAHMTGASTVTVSAVHTDGETGNVDRLLESRGSLWAAGTLVESSFGGGSLSDGFVARLDITTGKVLGVARIDAGALKSGSYQPGNLGDQREGLPLPGEARRG